MTWQPLGEVTLTSDWQAFAVPVAGEALLRVKQLYDSEIAFPVARRFWLGERIEGLGDVWRRTIYRNTDPQGRIYTLSPYPALEGGILERSLIVRHTLTGVTLSSPWTVSIDKWVQPLGSRRDGGEWALDGGVYE